MDTMLDIHSVSGPATQPFKAHLLALEESAF